MKLFVDDERQPPDDTWMVVRDGKEAIGTLLAMSSSAFNPKSGMQIFPATLCEVLSLDHDLGENVPTGYDVAAWLEEAVFTQGVVPPMLLRVHSANPVGRARILQTFQSIARYCEQNQMQVPKIEG